MPDYSTYFIKPTLDQPGNYYGSSGYSANGQRLTTPAKPASSTDLMADYPIWYQGKFVSKNTKAPFTGIDPWTQKHYELGKEITVIPGTDTKIDPNDPQQRYKPVDIVKSPDVASATSDLLESFKKSAADSLKGFDDYFTSFKDQIGGALKKSNAATDLAPFESATRGLQTRYSQNLDNISGNLANANADAAARERAVLSEARATLPRYDEAAQNVADRQMGALQQQLSRYKLGTGTPSSLGSDELRIAARGASDIQLPVQLAKIGRQYDLLSSMDLPIERDVTGRNTNYFQNFQPMVAGQQFTTGTATENAIQNLKLAVSTMSFDNALRYMQSLGVPAQIQQQILSGQIGQLGQIAQLEEGSRYRGLQDVLGVNLSQPQGYNMNFGAPPTYQPSGPVAPSRYAPTTSTGTGGAGVAGDLGAFAGGLARGAASPAPFDAGSLAAGFGAGGAGAASRYPAPSRYAANPIPDVSQQTLDYAATLV